MPSSRRSIPRAALRARGGRDQRGARKRLRGRPREARLRHRQGLSDYLGDQDAIEALCDEAPGDVYELENWGAVFSRTEDGRIAQRPFGAAGEPRTAYAADITGHVLVHVLYEQVMKRDIATYEEWFAWKLVEDDGRCQGVICWDLLNGGLKLVGAKTVILATGGAGRLYTGTTNAYSCTGDGMALALRMGVPLKDMEMMQFHPTTLSPSGVLITEGCRGEGAYLLNSEGERFLKNYAPNAMELASRDVISRAEQIEIDEGRGVDGNVLLDLRHLGAEKIIERLHGTRELSMVFAGVDPIYEPIPVRPGSHYHMGGVDTDLDGKTALEGLYAAGECACVSVHGANRLGGTPSWRRSPTASGAARAADWALANTVVAPPESALADAERELQELLGRREGERPHAIRDEMASTMHENFGVFRREEQMRRQGEIIQGLTERYERVVVEDSGPSSTPTSRRRWSSGSCSSLRPAWWRRGSPQGEPRRPRSPVRLSRPRRRALLYLGDVYKGGRRPSSPGSAAFEEAAERADEAGDVQAIVPSLPGSRARSRARISSAAELASDDGRDRDGWRTSARCSRPRTSRSATATASGPPSWPRTRRSHRGEDRPARDRGACRAGGGRRGGRSPSRAGGALAEGRRSRSGARSATRSSRRALRWRWPMLSAIEGLALAEAAEARLASSASAWPRRPPRHRSWPNTPRRASRRSRSSL